MSVFSSVCDSYNILILFPYPGKSHFVLYTQMFDILIAKGHNLTVVGFHHHQQTHPNFGEVLLGDGSEDKDPEFLSIGQFEMPQRMRRLRGVFFWVEFYERSCIGTHENEKFRKFLEENNKFDLLLVQYFLPECFLGVVKKYDIPYIGKFMQKNI